MILWKKRNLSHVLEAAILKYILKFRVQYSLGGLKALAGLHFASKWRFLHNVGHSCQTNRFQLLSKLMGN